MYACQLKPLDSSSVLYHLTKRIYLKQIFAEGLRINLTMDGLCEARSNYPKLIGLDGVQIKPIYLYKDPEVVSAMISSNWYRTEQGCVLKIQANGLDIYDPQRGYPGEIVHLTNIAPNRLSRSRYAEWRLTMMIKRREWLAKSMDVH